MHLLARGNTLWPNYRRTFEDSVDTWKAQQSEKKQDPNCYVGIDCDYIVPVWTSQRREPGGRQYKCKSSFPIPAAPFPFSVSL